MRLKPSQSPKPTFCGLRHHSKDYGQPLMRPTNSENHTKGSGFKAAHSTEAYPNTVWSTPAPGCLKKCIDAISRRRMLNFGRTDTCRGTVTRGFQPLNNPKEFRRWIWQPEILKDWLSRGWMGSMTTCSTPIAHCSHQPQPRWRLNDPQFSGRVFCELRSLSTTRSLPQWYW